MSNDRSRREFIRSLGISAAMLPFINNLPCLASTAAKRKQRLIIMFSPDGVVQENFWPDAEGETFVLKESLTPLEPFKNKTLIAHGVCDKIRGDGDGHMRGIGCLLTGIELFPGNVQGGSDTPAGWASGLSIDQEIKNYLQKDTSTKTHFGSLEFGVMVPDRADTWTRMSYAGANDPIAPISDPYQMFNKLYGRAKNQETLKSVLDDLREDLNRVRSKVSAQDRRILDDHAAMVRDMETDLHNTNKELAHAVPVIEPGVRQDNDNMPAISKLQIDLLVNSFAGDLARVATLQYTNSVGESRHRWLGINEGQHSLSHEPDNNKDAQTKLTKINKWYCEQMAYLAKRLSETPEPGGRAGETLLDNTLIVWTNELGKGNSHTPDNIPFVMVGNGLDFKMGRSLKLPKVAHNRLLMSFAHGFGHNITKFGNADFCGDGALVLG